VDLNLSKSAMMVFICDLCNWIATRGEPLNRQFW
jgi:hypothetical protein